MRTPAPPSVESAHSPGTSIVRRPAMAPSGATNTSVRLPFSTSETAKCVPFQTTPSSHP
jgi:hypothetical protein